MVETYRVQNTIRLDVTAIITIRKTMEKSMRKNLEQPEISRLGQLNYSGLAKSFDSIIS